MKHILDPTFQYVPSNETDIRKTFDRERARLAAAKADGLPPAPIASLEHKAITAIGRCTVATMADRRRS